MIVVDAIACRSCGHIGPPDVVRAFDLAIRIPAPNAVRRGAGDTRLCEPCWRRLTARPVRAAA